MKFLKTFFSKIVTKIKSLWSSLVGGKKLKQSPTSKLAITTPLVPNSETTPVSPTPTRVVSDDIAKNIAQAKDPLLKYLTPGSISFLCLTNKTLYKAYQPDAATSRLASHVLWNRLEEVKKLLESAKNDREKLEYLLTKTVAAPVTLPSGLLFKGLTPFQAALCTWNTALCEEFKKYFDQIPNGLAIMQAQITQIFPEGVEAYIEKQKADAEAFKDKTLKPLIATIRDASDEDVQTMLTEKQSNSDLGKAMTAFREKIKTLSGNEPVHNPFYLQAGFDLYAECFDRFRTWDQRALFCIQGIGCIQCYSPACDLQAFAQGLRDLVEEQKPFVRSFKFKHVWNSTSHLKINVKDFSGLGFDYWAVAGAPVFSFTSAPPIHGADAGWDMALWAAIGAARSTLQRLFEIFIEQKQQALRILCGACSSRGPVP